MSSPSINQNFISDNTPDLKYLLDAYKKYSDVEFNCHHLATVQSFNPENQTVIVTINYKQTRFYFKDNTEKLTSELVDYPPIQDCPLIVLGGGSARLTFPVKEGDQCILLHNDRDIDNWFNGSTSSPNSTPILHGFSECVALIGPNNLNTAIENYDPERALITNGTVKNGIHPVNNKLVLTNGVSLNDLLQNLCTQLQDLTFQLSILEVTAVTPAAPSPSNISGIPVNAPAITSIGTNISTIATQISTLIE